MQTSAEVESGDSGGPLVDEQGRVMGITKSAPAEGGGGSATAGSEIRSFLSLDPSAFDAGRLPDPARGPRRRQVPLRRLSRKHALAGAHAPSRPPHGGVALGRLMRARADLVRALPRAAGRKVRRAKSFDQRNQSTNHLTTTADAHAPSGRSTQVAARSGLDTNCLMPLEVFLQRLIQLHRFGLKHL